jgi:hypothetical protein
MYLGTTNRHKPSATAMDFRLNEGNEETERRK